MRQVKLIPTMEVWRVSDGQRAVINEKDFDGSLYTIKQPETEQPKRGRKAKDSRWEESAQN